MSLFVCVDGFFFWFGCGLALFVCFEERIQERVSVRALVSDWN